MDMVDRRSVLKQLGSITGIGATVGVASGKEKLNNRNKDLEEINKKFLEEGYEKVGKNVFKKKSTIKLAPVVIEGANELRGVKVKDWQNGHKIKVNSRKYKKYINGEVPKKGEKSKNNKMVN